MRKLILVLLVAVVAFAGCRKDDNTDNDGTVEVQFSATQGLNLKDGTDTECFDVQGDYAFVVINGEEYYLDVFYLNGIPYTQSIKLIIGGTYNVQEFMLMSDNNTPNNTADDYAISAAPHADSDFAGFVEQSLNIELELETFDKVELAIEVLCYEEDEHQFFGFVYFQFYEIVVRQECFFGDICVKSLEDYAGSLYADQPQGLQYDMPAIFYIEVWRNDTLQDTYSNEEFLGVGQTTCVWYADRLQVVDNFEFKLYIYVDDGPGFSYKYFHSWFASDADAWNHGDDGVMDFVLGSCVVDADVALMPYMDLPATCVLRFEAPTQPGNLGTYFDLQISGIPVGYDLKNGLWEGWCAQDGTFIDPNTDYNMDVYSSLYEDKLPPNAQGRNWDRINWLFNNFDWYEADAGYSWKAIQRAIWKLSEDDEDWNGPIAATAAEEALAKLMYNNAVTYGTDFIPLPGYWAAVIFVDQNNPEDVQVVFTVVDP